jgi:hypothetical protein
MLIELILDALLRLVLLHEAADELALGASIMQQPVDLMSVSSHRLKTTEPRYTTQLRRRRGSRTRTSDAMTRPHPQYPMSGAGNTQGRLNVPAGPATTGQPPFTSSEYSLPIHVVDEPITPYNES